MRRLLASLVPLLLVAAGATACSGAGADSPIVVLGPWVDDAGNPRDESDTIRQLLDAYGEKHGLTITYQGTRAIGPALRSKARDGTLPDIAIMPDVGELASYATEDLAQKVTGMVHAPNPPPGEAGVRIDHRALWRDREAYAVAVKTDLKSVMLYRRGGTPPPTTWEALFDSHSGATGVAPWCMGMSQTSSSGWPGTDWIEDILLHQQGPQIYARWASGDVSWLSTTVMQAWQAWGPVVRASNRSALLTTPVQAAEALQQGRCAMLHQSAFYVTGGASNIDFFAFPAPRGKAQPGVEVAGDFAALFSRRPAARDLLAYLTDARTGGTDWAERSGGAMHPVNVQPQLPAYGALTRRIAEGLQAATPRCIDASNSMPATMAAAFHSAVLEYLADPDRLGAILEGLEEIRGQIPLKERLTVACTA